MTASVELIDRLALIPHPEGGFYREVYRAPITFAYPSEEGQKERNTATSIYYLLRSQDRSAFHRLTSDEIWYFHAGSPLTLYMLDKSTGLTSAELGVTAGQQAQIMIPAGVWFGARVTVPDSYCLVSCMVTPGFDFADFEIASRAALMQQFPEHRGLIEQLT